MTHTVNIVKKTFTWTVVVATIAWSMGLAMLAPAPVQAVDCPTFAVGDMISSTISSAVYVVTGSNTLSAFPHSSVYSTWRADFSQVINKVPAACVDNYNVNGYVMPRVSSLVQKAAPGGAMYPTVYVVQPGNKVQKLASAADAAKYAGSNWESRIFGLAEVFFAFLVTDGDVSAVAENTIIEQSGVYYALVNGKWAKLSSMPTYLKSQVAKLSADVIAMYPMDGETTATELTKDPAQGGTPSVPGTDPVVVPGTAAVSLSANTPASKNIPVNVDNVVFTKVNVRAGSDADVKINSVKLGRKGLGEPEDIAEVTLYYGSTKLGNTRSWGSNQDLTYNISGGWTIPAGTTKELTIVAKLDAGKTGTYNAIGVLDMTLASGKVTGTPVYGNEMTGVSVTVGDVIIDNTGTISDKKIGDTNVSVAQFELRNGAKEAAVFTAITLKNKGTAADEDLANISLYKGSTKLAGPVNMVSDKISFVLDEGFSFDKSDRETFKVVADIVNGQNKTVEFVLDKTSDLNLVGEVYGTTLTVDSTAFDVAGEGDGFTIKGSQMNISLSSKELDTADDKDDVEFGTLTIVAGGTDMKINEFVVTVDETNGDGNPANKDLENFEMVETNGTSYSATKTNGGDANAADETWTFDDEIYLEAGKTYTFKFRADIQDGVGSADSYKMVLDTANMDAETQPEGDAVTDFSTAVHNGKNVTVKAPYAIVRSTAMNTGTAVINDVDVELYKGTIEAVAGDVHVEGLRFEETTNFVADNWTEVGLYSVSGTNYTLLQKISGSSLEDDVLDFDSLDLDVKVGSTNKVTFVVRGNVASEIVAPFATQIQLDTVTVKDTDNDAVLAKNASGATIANGNELTTTRSVTLSDKGVLYVQLRNNDTGYNKDRIVLAGSTVKVSKLRLKAEHEAIVIEDLKLENSDVDASDSVDQVCIYADEALTSKVGCGTMDTSGVVAFDDINYKVEVGTHDYYVVVTTNVMSDDSNGTADTLDEIALTLSGSDADNLIARGYASDEKLAFGDNDSTVDAGEIVLDKDLDGNYDEVADVDTATTKSFLIAGSRISSVALVSKYNGEEVDTVLNGTGEITLGILAITNENNSNKDEQGSALKLNLTNLIFDISKFASTTLSSATIERVGGTVGPVDADSIGDSNDNTATTSTLSFVQSDLGVDAELDAGEVAYFVVKANVSAVDSAAGVVDWVRLGLNNLNANNVDSNIQWTDGYTADVFRTLRLDTTSLNGSKIAENL